VTVDEARSAFLSLDGASEGEHHGHPDFRVGNKIFGTLQPDGGRVVLRLPEELAEAMAAENPVACKVVSRIGGMGWLAFELATTTRDEFEPLVQLAFERRRSKSR
jgi:hypothetical protein